MHSFNSTGASLLATTALLAIGVAGPCWADDGSSDPQIEEVAASSGTGTELTSNESSASAEGHSEPFAIAQFDASAARGATQQAVAKSISDADFVISNAVRVALSVAPSATRTAAMPATSSSGGPSGSPPMGGGWTYQSLAAAFHYADKFQATDPSQCAGLGAKIAANPGPSWCDGKRPPLLTGWPRDRVDLENANCTYLPAWDPTCSFPACPDRIPQAPVFVPNPAYPPPAYCKNYDPNGADGEAALLLGPSCTPSVCITKGTPNATRSTLPPKPIGCVPAPKPSIPSSQMSAMVSWVGTELIRREKASYGSAGDWQSGYFPEGLSVVSPQALVDAYLEDDARHGNPYLAYDDMHNVGQFVPQYLSFMWQNCQLTPWDGKWP